MGYYLLLRTGTLSWEDIENKADYEAGGMGISYAPKDSTIPLDARGLTPQMSPTVKDKADSTTKAAIAKGTIVITDKKNQGQDISTLNRDTESSLNLACSSFYSTQKKASQTSVKPFCMEKSIPHQAVCPALTLTPGRYALYFPFSSAL